MSRNPYDIERDIKEALLADAFFMNFVQSGGSHQLKGKIEGFLDSIAFKEKSSIALEIIPGLAGVFEKSETAEKLLNKTFTKYQEIAQTLELEYRDHIVHSLNVFLLGYYIYLRCDQFRNQIRSLVNPSLRNPIQRSNEEEFIFRWTLASIFHDVGYPFQILSNALNNYITQMLTDREATVFERRRANREVVSLLIPNLENLLPLRILPGIDLKFIEQDSSRHFHGYAVLDNPFEIIAFNLSKRHLPLDTQTIAGLLKRRFLKLLQRGRVDHGLLSAVILLKWIHGEYMTNPNFNVETFYFSVADSAAAISLHTLKKSNDYSSLFEKIHLDKHPIAYLLKLCDELQYWCRPHTKDGKRMSKGGSDDCKNEIEGFDLAFRDDCIFVKSDLYDDFKNNLEDYIDPFPLKRAS